MPAQATEPVGHKSTMPAGWGGGCRDGRGSRRSWSAGAYAGLSTRATDCHRLTRTTTIASRTAPSPCATASIMFQSAVRRRVHMVIGCRAAPRSSTARIRMAPHVNHPWRSVGAGRQVPRVEQFGAASGRLLRQMSSSRAFGMTALSTGTSRPAMTHPRASRCSARLSRSALALARPDPAEEHRRGYAQPAASRRSSATKSASWVPPSGPGTSSPTHARRRPPRGRQAG